VVDLPPEILLLSLACGWPSGANDSSFWCWRRLGAFRVEDPSRARKTRPNRCQNRAGPAGLGRPAWAQFSPVRWPLLLRGSSCTCVLCPLHLYDFDDVILASKMEVLFALSLIFYASIPGGVPRSTSVLATFGSDFIKLMNTNKTP
jgi:hypothetical protein